MCEDKNDKQKPEKTFIKKNFSLVAEVSKHDTGFVKIVTAESISNLKENNNQENNENEGS